MVAVIGNHVSEINFKVIPQLAQRYETAGDYWQDHPLPSAPWQFRVSVMENPDYEFLVLIHELTEWYLTQRRGIEEPTIAAFDQAFEERRKRREVDQDAEPGDDPTAPYHREHVFATRVEKLVAEELGADWETYDRAILSLFEEA
jgi:hypothetical protein